MCVCLYVCISDFLYVLRLYVLCLFMCLSVYMSVYMSVCLSVQSMYIECAVRVYSHCTVSVYIQCTVSTLDSQPCPFPLSLALSLALSLLLSLPLALPLSLLLFLPCPFPCPFLVTPFSLLCPPPCHSIDLYLVQENSRIPPLSPSIANSLVPSLVPILSLPCHSLSFPCLSHCP